MIKNISDFNKFDNVIITNDNIEKIRKKLKGGSRSGII